jgi:hypothetical protein
MKFYYVPDPINCGTVMQMLQSSRDFHNETGTSEVHLLFQSQVLSYSIHIKISQKLVCIAIIRRQPLKIFVPALVMLW